MYVADYIKTGFNALTYRVFFYLLRALECSQTPPRYPRTIFRKCKLFLVHIPKIELHPQAKSH